MTNREYCINLTTRDNLNPGYLKALKNNQLVAEHQICIRRLPAAVFEFKGQDVTCLGLGHKNCPDPDGDRALIAQPIQEWHELMLEIDLQEKLI